MDIIQIYRSRRLLSSGWRWRYIAAGNHARMGNGGESYVTRMAAVEGAARVCGLPLLSPEGRPTIAVGKPGEVLVTTVRRAADSVILDIRG